MYPTVDIVVTGLAITFKLLAMVISTGFVPLLRLKNNTNIVFLTKRLGPFYPQTFHNTPFIPKHNKRASTQKRNMRVNTSRCFN